MREINLIIYIYINKENIIMLVIYVNVGFLLLLNIYLFSNTYINKYNKIYS